MKRYDCVPFEEHEYDVVDGPEYEFVGSLSSVTVTDALEEVWAFQFHPNSVNFEPLMAALMMTACMYGSTNDTGFCISVEFIENKVTSSSAVGD